MEEVIYGELLDYFEKTTATQISNDMGFTYSTAKRIKEQVNKARAGEEVPNKPALLAKVISHYITQVSRNSFE